MKKTTVVKMGALITVLTFWFVLAGCPAAGGSGGTTGGTGGIGGDSGAGSSTTVPVDVSANMEDFNVSNIAAANIHAVYNESTWKTACTHIDNNPGNHIIYLTGDFSLPGNSYNFPNVANIKVSIRGARTITLSSKGYLLSIRENQTVILREAIVKGKGEGFSAVIDNFGNFIMKSGTLSGGLSGVTIWSETATFTMDGGTISGNSQSSGGGVRVDKGTFIMNGGAISDNSASDQGGGVVVGSNTNTATFIMNGGTISGNSASDGGGVAGAFFTMNDGTISGNTASGWASGGGGVSAGIFTMNGGTISGNSASNSGGGVYTGYLGGIFTKTAGIIYGSNASATDKNTASADNKGHAIFIDGSNKWDTTSGPNDIITYP